MHYNELIFFGFFFVLIVLIYTFRRFSKRVLAVLAHILALSIGIFYGSRDFIVGTDTKEYVERFQSGLVTEDYIFSGLSSFTHHLGLSPAFFLTLIAVLTSLFMLRALKNFSGSYVKASLFLVLAAVLPYGVMSYVNIIRQGLAVSLVLYGLSLLYAGLKRRGTFLAISSLFIHSTSGIVLMVSYIFNKISNIKWLATKFVVGFISLSLLFVVLLFALNSNTDIANRFLNYSAIDSSESPYLIYLKIVWGIFHGIIIVILNRRSKIFPPLYSYLMTVLIMSVLLISNPLISSRFLASLDFILPVIYASYVGYKGKLYVVAIASMIVYATLSPFIFNMYDTFFN